jgi:hypothetical protein
MIYVEVYRFSANLRVILSRGCPLDSGKGPVRFVPLSGPKLARRSREQAYGPDHGEILITQRSGCGTDTIGVPDIWFPFGIGVSRTQYVYAIAIPLLAFLIVRERAP